MSTTEFQEWDKLSTEDSVDIVPVNTTLDAIDADIKTMRDYRTAGLDKTYARYDLDADETFGPDITASFGLTPGWTASAMNEGTDGTVLFNAGAGRWSLSEGIWLVHWQVQLSGVTTPTSGWVDVWLSNFTAGGYITQSNYRARAETFDGNSLFQHTFYMKSEVGGLMDASISTTDELDFTMEYDNSSSSTWTLQGGVGGPTFLSFLYDRPL